MSELIALRVADARPAPGFRPSRQAAGEPLAVATSALSDAPEIDLFDAGYRQGLRDAERSYADERANYGALIAGCEAFQPEPSEALALLIAEAVEMLVRQAVGEVSLDHATLKDRARRAASLAADVDGLRVIHLNPEDLALFGPDALPLAAVADSTLSRGSLRIEHPMGWIEDGVAVHLDALREQLGLKERSE